MILSITDNILYKSCKNYLYQILEEDTNSSKASYFINIGLSILISLNVIAVILETVEEIYIPFAVYFEALEIFSVALFTIEYIIRAWISTESAKYKGSFSGRIKYLFSTFALIDLIAILPFFLSMAVDLTFIRVIRLLRILRIFKIVRYVKALQIITKVLREKKEELAISIVLVFIMLILVSCVMFHIENKAQPEAFRSIPETMWWGIATLTTVGYGDVYPITKAGKLLAAVVAILGIGLFALPTGIIASGFSEEISKQKEERDCQCPHCGKNIKP
ncbi:MAG: ion transporter [Cytophagaceae bacterium]